MRKEFALIMIVCTIGASSAYGDSQINITQSPGQTVSPIIVSNSTNNVLFQVLAGGQAIIDEFIQFSGSGLTALRTYIFPDSDGTVVLEDFSQNLTQKTIDADSNTISNIDDSEIKTNAGIDVTKLSSGIVDNGEFDRLDGLVADIQPQLNGKIDNGENVGTGEGLVFKEKSGMNLRFKSIKAGSNIAITNNADEILIDSTSSGGETNTASNLGTGRQLFKQKIGTDLQFRTLTQGQGMSLTQNSDDVSIQTNFKIDNISQVCSGTDKVSAITFNNVTGDTVVICSSDQIGSSGPVKLAADVTCSAIAPSYCIVFTIPLTASKAHTIDFSLSAESNTAGATPQIRVRIDDAGNTGFCTITHFTTATAQVLDTIAIGTAPADDGENTWLPGPNIAQTIPVYCSLVTDATPGNLILEMQAELPSTVRINGGSFYIMQVET